MNIYGGSHFGLCPGDPVFDQTIWFQATEIHFGPCPARTNRSLINPVRIKQFLQSEVVKEAIYNR